MKVYERSYCTVAISVVLFASGNVALANDTLDQGNASPASNTVKSGVEIRSEKVTYGDLNTDRTAGVEALYQRIGAAAKSVCGGKQNVRNLSLKMRRDWKNCYHTAFDQAIASTALPQLVAYHQDETGRVIATDEALMASRTN